MARPSTSPAARIRRLEAAQERARKLRSGTVLSAKPMAELLGVGWPVLRDWCDDVPALANSDAFTRGGNGVEWEFKAQRTVTLLLKHFRAEQDAQGRRSRALTKAVGVTLPDADADVSLAEVRDRVNLTMTLTGAMERQGQYVLASTVATFLAGFCQHVVDGIMGVRTKVDPNGNLPPAVRREVDKYLRSVATGAHAEATRFIEEHKVAGSQPAGVGRAG